MRRKRPRRALIAIIILSVALVATLVALDFYLIKLNDANSRVEQQDRQIQDQQDLIEKKETFGAAMQGLMDTAHEFDGALVSSMIPVKDYESVVAQAWSHRWDPDQLDEYTTYARTAKTDLEDLLSVADTERTTNQSGTEYEAIIDELGQGFVVSKIDDADRLCQSDVLACVSGYDPLTVHFDAEDNSVPYMTDWVRAGIAYHEFAHVLQFAHPEPTEEAVAAFGDDVETMADCFALTYLDGWTLDQQIWINDYQYWEVSIGYGYTCNEVQRQVIRDWFEQLEFHADPISQ